jgi:hypothetical protein
MAEAMLLLVHRNCHRLSTEDYDRLYSFLKACKARLPRQATVLRDAEKKSTRAHTERGR